MFLILFENLKDSFKKISIDSLRIFWLIRTDSFRIPRFEERQFQIFLDIYSPLTGALWPVPGPAKKHKEASTGASWPGPGPAEKHKKPVPGPICGQYRGQQKSIKKPVPGPICGQHRGPIKEKERKKYKKEIKERKEKYIRFPLSCKGGWLTPAPASRESGCTRYFFMVADFDFRYIKSQGSCGRPPFTESLVELSVHLLKLIKVWGLVFRCIQSRDAFKRKL